MANKFQSAMPGALLGTDHIIAFLLHHFYLLYVSLMLFSAAELITGLCLMAGLLTRAAALVSIGLSVRLMLMFGWQGATCIDEWTMAACNLAIGATLMLGGSGRRIHLRVLPFFTLALVHADNRSRPRTRILNGS